MSSKQAAKKKSAAAAAPAAAKKNKMTPQQQAKALKYHKDETKRAVKEAELQSSVLKVFQKFDTDNSGTISTAEFQELVFCLGLTLTAQQVQKLVNEIDTDKNGTVEFEEFFKWWKNGPASLNSTDKSPSNILKLQLRSKSFLRTLERLQPKVANQDLGQIKASITIGPDVSTPLPFSFSCNVKETHGEANSGSVSVFLSLKNDDVDHTPWLAAFKEFLVEAGEDTDMLFETKAEIASIDGTKGLLLTCSTESEELVSMANIFAGVDLRLLFESSKSFAEMANLEVAPTIKIGFAMSYLRSVMSALANSKESEEENAFCAFLASTKKLGVEYHYESVGDLLKLSTNLTNSNGADASFIKQTIFTLLQIVFVDEETDEHTVSLYKTLVEPIAELFSEIRTVTITAGKLHFEIASKGIFDLSYIPKYEELVAAQKAELAQKATASDQILNVIVYGMNAEIVKKVIMSLLADQNDDEPICVNVGLPISNANGDTLPAKVWNRNKLDDDTLSAISNDAILFVYAVDLSQRDSVIPSSQGFVGLLQETNPGSPVVFVGVNPGDATENLFTTKEGEDAIAEVRAETEQAGFFYYDWVAEEDVIRLLLPLTVGVTHFLTKSH